MIRDGAAAACSGRGAGAWRSRLSAAADLPVERDGSSERSGELQQERCKKNNQGIKIGGEQFS